MASLCAASEKERASVQVRGTGKLAILGADGGDLTPRGRKPRAILAYLASRPGRQVSRETLMDLLWGDRGEAQARASLRQALLEIRRSCGDLVQADREHVWIDEARLAIERDAQGGEPFADLNNITPEFDEWLRRERERQSGEAVRDLRHQIEQLLARGRSSSAAPLVERMRAIDPYNEDCLRLAMQADYQAGQPAALEKRFKEMEQLLKRELGVVPAAETRALRDRLLSELTRVPESAPVQEACTTIRSQVESARPFWRRKWIAAASVAAIAASGGLVYKASTASAEPPRLAILPFAAGAGVDSALAEGLSDELHVQLVRNSRIRVIGRTSAAQFKGAPADLRNVGRTLDARYIVEGTVRQRDGRVSIFVSLVRAGDGSALWSRNFAGAADRLEAVEAAIESEIGRSLGAGVLPAAKSQASGQAYALYVRAKALMRDRNSDSLSKAVELLQEAVRIDPNFAGAWAQLAAASQLANRKEVIIDLNGRKVRISKREATERALQLDPNLAEAHASLALIDGRTSRRAVAHLRRAIELKPNDTQIRYWWAATVAETGDYKRAGEMMRQIASLDPLWKRPVQEAITASLVAGDRPAALRYLRIIKEGNPAAAVEVEGQMAYYDADFSRVVQLELIGPFAPWDGGKARAVRTLLSLGFVREALLIGPFGPFARAVIRGNAPQLPEILERIRSDAEEGDALPIYAAVSWELAKEQRWKDLAAIYDAGFGLVRDVKGNHPGGRYYRQIFAPIYAIALNRVGRNREAVELATKAAEGARFTLARGKVQPEPLVAIAGTEAVLGRRGEALDHLEEAFAKNWRLDEFVRFRLGERPEFATLRGDPRFERLRRIQDAHIAKERREILALGIF